MHTRGKNNKNANELNNMIFLHYDYIVPLWVSGPFVLLNSGVATYVRTDGMKKLAIALPIVSNAINLALDYVYM